MADEHHEARPTPGLQSSVDVATKRYRLQRARYERAAAVVAETISGALRRESIRHLLSFRAKHPDEFADKLLRKRGSEKYERIGEDVNEVVTDLAGVRIVVYDPRDEVKVATVVRRVLKVADGPSCDTDFARPPYNDRNGSTEYQATHLLVMAPEGPEHGAIHGARCEVQICNVAAHLFNEVEHDITYKRKEASPTAKTLDALKSLRDGCRKLEQAAADVFKRHERDVKDQEMDLLDAEDLRSGLEKAAGTFYGDFRALFHLLSPVMKPLTVRGIEQSQGRRIAELVADGRERWIGRGRTTAIDEVTALALALLTSYGPEFHSLAAEWEGSPSPVVEAILAEVAAATEGA